MEKSPAVKTLFLDIGGVLLTNGWDRQVRKKACQVFNLDEEEVNERHHLTFDTYEEGKLSLDDYLNRTIFYENRPFSREEFKAFMFDQSQPFSETLDFFRSLKARYSLKTVAVSNEGRELTVHRIEKFDLGSVIDFYVSSCFVHFRKPDADIYRMALDVAQTPPDEVVYIDDREMFVQVAQGLGIRSIHHENCQSTQAALDSYKLRLDG
jgi:putative hydrolase of the HAD superfamily